jgi:hypothetical protein
MAPGKTKKRHGYGSKKKKLKWRAGLDLKKRTKDVDQIHVSADFGWQSSHILSDSSCFNRQL